MDWMKNKFSGDYKTKHKNLVDSVNRLYGALGFVRDVPNYPATRRNDMDKGLIKMGGWK